MTFSTKIGPLPDLTSVTPEPASTERTTCQPPPTEWKTSSGAVVVTVPPWR